MMKVFGGYPVARSETEYFRCGIPGQRTPTETNTPVMYEMLTDYEWYIFYKTYQKIRYGIDYNKIQNNDEPPF